MKRVFQTIIDKDHGNCEQAAMASLLELTLDEVPNFIEFAKLDKREGDKFPLGFLWDKGFDACYINRTKHHDTTEFLQRIAAFDGGYKGYFIASVPSQTFDGVDHSVIINTNLNIVHDPNPNQRALKLTPDDVKGFISMNPMVIGKTGKLFTKKDWERTSEEERNQNTWNTKDNLTAE
jgi:hypothetical protein